MITPLRRRHRWLAPGAFGLALVGLGVALAARPTAFVEAARHARESTGISVRDGAILVSTDGRCAVAYERALARLWVVPHEPLDAPDLLVYRADEAGVGDALPTHARLLGPASSTATTSFDLGLEPGPGFIVLYSLGHAARVDAFDLRDVLPGEAH